MAKVADYYDAFWMQNEQMRANKTVYPWTFLEVHNSGHCNLIRYYSTIAQMALEYDLFQFGPTIKLPKLKKKQEHANVLDPTGDYDRAMRGL